jgi:amylosucrase
VASLNDHAYLQDEGKAADSRWVHRPRFSDAQYRRRHNPFSAAGTVFAGLKHLIAQRRGCEAFAGGHLSGFRSGNPTVLGYLRAGQSDRILVLANFSEHPQYCPAHVFQALPATAIDLISDHCFALKGGVELAPYSMVWLSIPSN